MVKRLPRPTVRDALVFELRRDLEQHTDPAAWCDVPPMLRHAVESGALPPDGWERGYARFAHAAVADVARRDYCAAALGWPGEPTLADHDLAAQLVAEVGALAPDEPFTQAQVEASHAHYLAADERRRRERQAAEDAAHAPAAATAKPSTSNASPAAAAAALGSAVEALRSRRRGATTAAAQEGR